MSARKIAFLATEDWFVRSHFLPLLKRARADGFDVVVAARQSGALKDIDGVHLIDMPFSRRSLAPLNVWRESRAVRDLLQAEQPDIVHAIALKPIALLLLADTRTPTVLALTGRGYLEVRGGWRRLALASVRARARASIKRGRSVVLVENQSDLAWVWGRKDIPAERMLVMPGAGVDTNQFRVALPPPAPPIIVGLAARLVASKGIDVAVAAITKLRSAGFEIELHIAGAVDAGNPDHLVDAVVDAWRRTPGVNLIGQVSDINAFWATTHIACLPSRGGEGLPRSLLEAAACGRPIVTTDTPGCADFVVPGETGLLAPPDNAHSLGAAIFRLANEEGLRLRMGIAARARVIAQYTEAHAADVASEAWRRCLALQR